MLFSVFLIYDQRISLADGSNDMYLQHDLTEKAYSKRHIQFMVVRAVHVRPISCSAALYNPAVLH